MTTTRTWTPRFGQLGLGDLIAALAAEDPNRVLPVGFHEPHSYRGYCADLAFEPAFNISIGDMLAAARSALGSTFQGWKGGDFTMSEHTDCWIATRGDCSDDQIGPLLLSALLAQPDVEPPVDPSKCQWTGPARCIFPAAPGDHLCEGHREEVRLAVRTVTR